MPTKRVVRRLTPWAKRCGLPGAARERMEGIHLTQETKRKARRRQLRQDGRGAGSRNIVGRRWCWCPVVTRASMPPSRKPRLSWVLAPSKTVGHGRGAFVKPTNDVSRANSRAQAALRTAQPATSAFTCGTLRRRLGTRPRVPFIAARSSTTAASQQPWTVLHTTHDPSATDYASHRVVLGLTARLSAFQHRALRFWQEGMPVEESD